MMGRLNLFVGAGLVGAWLVAVAVSSVYTPADPLSMDFSARLQAPAEGSLMGTDQYGRDLYSRVLAASRISFGVSFATVVFAMTLGAVIGALAGYVGGLTDRIVVMCLDALMAFPPLLLVLMFLSVVGPSVPAVVLALGVGYTPTAARVMRGTVLSIREVEYVEASRVLGGSDAWTLWRHVLPNAVSPLTVLATSMFATVLLLESALSFLGLGVPPPAATWGGLLADGRQFLSQAPWLCIFPGLVISLALLGVNLLGDALRDRLDPHQRDAV
ncbi:MAG: ABC transporter permease [Sphingomonadales bacterium]|nr:ABC transporter permease [Sphingomonadales bacterium]